MKHVDGDKYVKIYGEEFRVLIEDSLKWLNKKEIEWGLKLSINRDKFISELIGKRGKLYGVGKIRS